MVDVLGLLLTWKPAELQRADRAARRGSPLTFGTLTVAGAWATTIVTVEPCVASEPPAGFWLITLPACTVLEVWFVGLTLKPAPVSLEVAADWLSPRTSGTETCGWPEETSSVTPVPGGTRLGGTGIGAGRLPGLEARTSSG